MKTEQTREAKDMIIEVAELTCRNMIKEALQVASDNCDDKEIDPTMLLKLVSKIFDIDQGCTTEVFALMSRDAVVQLGYKDAYLKEMLRLQANYAKDKSNSNTL